MRGFASYLLPGALVLALFAGCGSGSERGTTTPPGPASVLLDGRANDAMNDHPPLVDKLGDVEDGVDIDTVAVAVEDGRLLLRVYTHSPIGLQNGSGLELLLDLDPGKNTSLAGQTGAELVWQFGEREGVLATPNGEVTFEHAAIGMITAPTVSSTVFEIGFDLDASVDGHQLLTSDVVGLAMRDTHSGDRAPDSGFHTVDLSRVATAPEVLPVAKPDPTAVRVVAWNVLFDGIVERPETFDPVLDVLEPDVLILSEVWDTPAKAAVELMNQWRPLPDGASWYGAKQGADIIVVSKTPVLDSWPIEDARAGAFLVEMPDPFSEPLFVIGAHPPCCGKNTERQLEIDAIMAFVRDARRGTGIAKVPEGAPLIIGGDMNLVGYDEQLTTFVEGRIVNTDEYGEPFPPDSDGSGLLDLFPRHLQDNVVYTWRQDDSGYGPGKLDYLFIGDADLHVAHSFIFDTRLLDDALLDELGLTRDASPAASDHVPVIADLLPVE